METCLICRKHKGQEAIPPGEYIYTETDAIALANKLRQAMKAG